MGTKRITELTNAAAITDDIAFPCDDGIETFQASGAQFLAYILGAGKVPRAALAAGAYARYGVRTITATTGTAAYTDDVILLDCTANPIALALPAVTGQSGSLLHLIKIDSTTNLATVDANSSELIDFSLTQVLRAQWEVVTYINTGAQWVRMTKPSGSLVYTPTITGCGTVSGVDFRWRHIGPDITKVKGRFVCGSTTAANVSITLPNSETISSLDLNAAVVSRFGEFNAASTSLQQINNGSGMYGVVMNNGTTNDKVYFVWRMQSQAYILENGNDWFASGDLVNVEFEYMRA